MGEAWCWGNLSCVDHVRLKRQQSEASAIRGDLQRTSDHSLHPIIHTSAQV